jgi:hypothetical protein
MDMRLQPNADHSLMQVGSWVGQSTLPHMNESSTENEDTGRTADNNGTL